ncbi:MAG: hypothetical protein ABJA81_02800, partial [Nocardioidaceae bacterium]
LMDNARALGAVLLVAAALLPACTGGPTTAELLATPFPGSVLSASSSHVCKSPCMATYRVRITNPTQGDASVQECAVSPAIPGLDRLPVMGIAGLSVPAGQTRTTTAKFELPLGPHQVGDLAGRDLVCTGIDWHGNLPI